MVAPPVAYTLTGTVVAPPSAARVVNVVSVLLVPVAGVGERLDTLCPAVTLAVYPVAVVSPVTTKLGVLFPAGMAVSVLSRVVVNPVPVATTAQLEASLVGAVNLQIAVVAPGVQLRSRISALGSMMYFVIVVQVFCAGKALF